MIPVVTPEEMGAVDAAAPEPVEVLIDRAGAADRVGGEHSGEEGLADALTRHDVTGGGGVAHEQGPAGGERHRVHAGRDRPRPVRALGHGGVTEHRPDRGDQLGVHEVHPRQIDADPTISRLAGHSVIGSDDVPCRKRFGDYVTRQAGQCILPFCPG